jgi:glycosyltransferase involved in cell wall biosynthesis
MRGAIDCLRDGWIVSGHVVAPNDAERIGVTVFVDGRSIGDAVANMHVGSASDGQRLAFELAMPFNFHDGETHVIEARVADAVVGQLHAVVNQAKPYHDLASFLGWAFYHRVMPTPFTDVDKICLGNMDLMATHLAKGASTLPLVSIVMPVLIAHGNTDRTARLRRAIASVQAQHHATWELLIVDDGSAQSLDALVGSFADPRIKFWRLEHNRGQSAARNYALTHASGAYIAYLDSDNHWDPRFLTVMVNALASEAQFDAAYCGQHLHNAHDIPVGVRVGPYNPTLIENSNYVDLNCLVHRRALTTRFDESLRALEDWDFVLRLSETKALRFVPVVLSTYCFTPDAVSHSPAVPESWRCIMAKRKQEIEATPQSVRAHTSIIIPSFNVPEVLRECVQRIFRTTRGCEVIICDDGSDAETLREISKLQQEFPELRLSASAQSLGFTHAVNRGMQLAAEDNHVVILNNDAFVTHGWLNALLAEAKTGVGLVVPQQLLPAGTHTILNHAPCANQHADIDVNLSAHHKNVLAYGGADKCVELTFAPFFCVLITPEARQAVGLLSALGAHYRSDSHYCFAVRQFANLRIVYTPAAKVYHLLQRSTRALRLREPAAYAERIAVHPDAPERESAPGPEPETETTRVPPGHFYSPIVSTQALALVRDHVFDRTRVPAGIDLNEPGQLAYLDHFAALYPALRFQRQRTEDARYYYDNPAFGAADALVLACLLLHHKPKRLIEFGSGFSSCVAMDINEQFFANAIDLTFIDPYPELFQQLTQGATAPYRLLHQPAQKTNLSMVRSLNAGDVVFIDSTHVSKAGSDVNFHVFELLPALAPGVLIHFHDVFYPFEYPEAWFFEENRSWNELYLLRALLMNSDAYEIVFFNDFMARRHSEAIKRAMPDFFLNSGGSLWLRKTSATAHTSEGR